MTAHHDKSPGWSCSSGLLSVGWSFRGRRRRWPAAQGRTWTARRAGGRSAIGGLGACRGRRHPGPVAVAVAAKCPGPSRYPGIGRQPASNRWACELRASGSEGDRHRRGQMINRLARPGPPELADLCPARRCHPSTQSRTYSAGLKLFELITICPLLRYAITRNAD